MHKFWIKFDVRFGGQTYGVLLGCGVTADNQDEAIQTAAKVIFRGDPTPRILSVIEDVEVSGLDAKHVLPNMGDSNLAGVWYPAYNVAR
jgi:hypothetical protein